MWSGFWARRERVLLAAVCLSWFLISLISLNHLFFFTSKLVFSTHLLGLLGWLAIAGTLLFLAREFRRQVALIFLAFFLFGFWCGPYLEPPSDPFEHLRRIQDFAGVSSNLVPKVNRGLWHYSMAGDLIGCSICTDNDPERMLFMIDIAHGLFLGVMMSGLFVLGKNAGLKSRWAFLSCLIAFLFFGTNRFSYFTYYSFAPSFTSILIFWLWTAAFFFKKEWRAQLSGIVFAILSLPVLIVNHLQEAVFVSFILVIWILLNMYLRVLPVSSTNRGYSRGIILFFGSVLFLIFFVLPQYSYWRDFLSQFFVRDYWLVNQKLIVTWKGLFLWGKLWSFRINDTLGNIAVVMLPLTIPFFWPRIVRDPVEKKLRIWTLAFLPFFGYCVPLFHFIWLANVHPAEYYRLCYLSMFWLLFAFFFQGLEGRVCLARLRFKQKRARYVP